MFRKAKARSVSEHNPTEKLPAAKAAAQSDAEASRDERAAWMAPYTEEELLLAEEDALRTSFGSKLERQVTHDERTSGVPFRESRLMRQDYVRRFMGQRLAQSA